MQRKAAVKGCREDAIISSLGPQALSRRVGSRWSSARTALVLSELRFSSCRPGRWGSTSEQLGQNFPQRGGAWVGVDARTISCVREGRRGESHSPPRLACLPKVSPHSNTTPRHRNYPTRIIFPQNHPSRLLAFSQSFLSSNHPSLSDQSPFHRRLLAKMAFGKLYTYPVRLPASPPLSPPSRVHAC